MSNLVRLVIFSVAVIGAFTLFSTHYVPDISTDLPPAAPVDTAEGPAALAAVGEALYNGRGACALCHDPVSARAPALEGIMAVAAARINEPGYGGAATDAFEYLLESMVEPSAYVVKGFGVAGTGGTVSPMPDVSGAEIGLTRAEIDSVIAYLARLSGIEYTGAAGAAKDTGGEEK